MKRYTIVIPKVMKPPGPCIIRPGFLHGFISTPERSKDLDQALLLYRRLTDEYEDHRLSDDAQYKIGEIFYKYKKDPTQAYVEFLKVDIKISVWRYAAKGKKDAGSVGRSFKRKRQ